MILQVVTWGTSTVRGKASHVELFRTSKNPKQAAMAGGLQWYAPFSDHYPCEFWIILIHANNSTVWDEHFSRPRKHFSDDFHFSWAKAGAEAGRMLSSNHELPIQKVMVRINCIYIYIVYSYCDNYHDYIDNYRNIIIYHNYPNELS